MKNDLSSSVLDLEFNQKIMKSDKRLLYYSPWWMIAPTISSWLNSSAVLNRALLWSKELCILSITHYV
jgi:hypothetical protein